jgi:hypothetical protein
MAYSTILANIKSTVEGVSGIGKVYDYERWAANWGTVLALFKTSNNIIHGWTISRIAFFRQSKSIGDPEIAHIFRIRGVYGLDDSAAAEKTFQGIVNLVADAFDANMTLSGACLTLAADWGPMANQVGLQVPGIDVRAFGNVLCHHADCRLCALEGQ